MHVTCWKYESLRINIAEIFTRQFLFGVRYLYVVCLAELVAFDDFTRILNQTRNEGFSLIFFPLIPRKVRLVGIYIQGGKKNLFVHVKNLHCIPLITKVKLSQGIIVLLKNCFLII